MPLKNVSREFPPTFLVHGEADTDVPPEQSVMMAAEFRRLGVEHRLALLPRAEHGLRGAEPSAIDQVFRDAGEFLRRHLRPPPPSVPVGVPARPG